MRIFLLLIFCQCSCASLSYAINQSEQDSLLQKAILATKAIEALDEELGISTSELIKLALFIETDFFQYYQNKEYYLTAEKTGLARSVEYDPKTGYCFIHLETKNIPRLGKGAKKLVTKSILYDIKNPEVLARCQQAFPFNTELQLIQILKGSRGILQVRAVTQHQENDIHYYAMFCKLYQPGPISKIIRHPSYQLTVEEKIKIALDIVSGLAALQKHGIIHRDLGHRNCLVHISKKRNHKRVVEAVIADFGWGLPVSAVQGLQAQGHTSYTAPEGILFHTLLSHEYFSTDLFAAGSLIYQIACNKKPAWLHTNLIKNELLAEVRYRKHVALIQKETHKRRMYLIKKNARLSKLSVKEELEAIILQMIDPDASKRGTASEIREKLKKLLHRTQR